MAQGEVAEHPDEGDGDRRLRLAAAVWAAIPRPVSTTKQDGLGAGGDPALDQRAAVPGGRLPVDVTDLVAEDVLAQVVEVEAAAPEHRGVLAVEQAAGPPVGDDEQLALDRRQQGGHGGGLRESRTVATIASMTVSTRRVVGDRLEAEDDAGAAGPGGRAP